MWNERKISYKYLHIGPTAKSKRGMNLNVCSIITKNKISVSPERNHRSDRKIREKRSISIKFLKEFEKEFMNDLHEILHINLIQEKRYDNDDLELTTL